MWCSSETLHYSAVKTAVLWERAMRSLVWGLHPVLRSCVSAQALAPCLSYVLGTPVLTHVSCWSSPFLMWPPGLTSDLLHHYRHFWWSLSDKRGYCSALLVQAHCSAPLILENAAPVCPTIILTPPLTFPCGTACSCCSLAGNLIQLKFSLIPWPKCFYYMCSSKLSKEKLLCWKAGCIPPSSSELNDPI